MGDEQELYPYYDDCAVKAAGTRSYPRLLAVVPPATGKRVSHLVVGTQGESELLVLALPGLALVHTHELQGMCIKALAADPWGESLALSATADNDYFKDAIYVLAWPLPGVAALE